MFKRRHSYPNNITPCKNCYEILKEIENLYSIIKKLEDKVKELEVRLNEKEPSIVGLSPPTFKLDPLPSPEDSQIKDFHLHMKSISSYDTLEV